MELIRVLVIDDSAFMRKMISDILESDHRIKVIGTARNGEDGLYKLKNLSPDVITLDVEMPVMDGITTLKKIMEMNPLPVVMVSSVTSKGAAKTIQAISSGAVDFIEKPSGSISLDMNKIGKEIIMKVVTASKVKLSKAKTKPLTEVTKRKKGTPEKLQGLHRQSHKDTIVAIGTSTGGPRALQQVLTEIPKSFPAPILIVQHMPPNFTKSLADRINTLSKIHVKEASNGEILKNGTAYIAPGDYHMQIRKAGRSLAIELSQDKPVYGHRPAVDVLINSIANLKEINKVVVILTGMGRDGSEGLVQMKDIDEETIVIAESEESSVVYGMPYAAVKTGYVNQVSHIDKVGEDLVRVVRKTRGL